MHSELAGLIGGGGNDAALIALPANYNCFAFQRGIEQFFHGHEEGVHIDVEDGAEERGLVGGSHMDGNFSSRHQFEIMIAK